MEFTLICTVEYPNKQVQGYNTRGCMIYSQVCLKRGDTTIITAFAISVGKILDALLSDAGNSHFVNSKWPTTAICTPSYR